MDHTGFYERIGLSYLSRKVNRLVDKIKSNEDLAKKYEGRDMDLYDDIMAILRAEGIYMVDNTREKSFYLLLSDGSEYSSLKEMVEVILTLDYTQPTKAEDISY